ncbi:endoribonuclease XendoU, partial [Oesophagostomum dentatum]
ERSTEACEYCNYLTTDTVPVVVLLSAFNVQNSELLQVSKQLRDADDNRAQPGQIYISYQSHTSTRDAEDNARRDFFTKVDPAILRKSSFQQFIALTNNFVREAGISEPRVPISEEKRETTAFLTTVLQSKPWKVLYAFLRQKKHPFAKDPITFRYWMAQLWFVHYSRARGRADTSGFEHVFIGEEKNHEISGLHNWVRLYQLEKNETEDFDYKGFVIKRGNVMASLKFTWKGDLKRSGSVLIGTSPEYDMALYTLCFLSRRGRQQCDVEIDGCPFSITSYDIVQNNKVFIGTIFPTAGPMTEQCRRFGGRLT